MLGKYDKLNYDMPCLSNYNSITTYPDRDLVLNVYEHGMNIGFTHHLVINTDSASKMDFPFFQFASHKQYSINRLKTENNLIVLAHPSFKSGYSLEELTYLKNYDLMEVISHRAKSIRHWDQALTSGKIVWAIGNDDSHDTLDGNFGIAWTMIRVTERKKQHIMNSLRAGNCFATKGWKGKEMNELQSLEVEGGVYSLKLKNVTDSITLFGDYGKDLAIAVNTDEIKSSDSYVEPNYLKVKNGMIIPKCI
jgi:hypothetical protein